MEQNLLSGYCQVSSKSTAVAFYDVQSVPQNILQGFEMKHSNASHIRAVVSDLELTWQYQLTEFCPKQTNAAYVNFTFHYGPLLHHS